VDLPCAPDTQCQTYPPFSMIPLHCRGHLAVVTLIYMCEKAGK